MMCDICKRISVLLVFIAACGYGTTYYVSPAGSNTDPYNTWEKAAHDIQTAVDSASAGDTVLVADGVYDTGGAITPGYACMNRVCITEDITVSSVNGPEHTSIVGEGPVGSGAVRGVYMSAGLLCGFTVTNGHALTSGDSSYDQCGGGVNGYGGDGTVSNCVVIGNEVNTSGGGYGGGCYYGTFVQCDILNNQAYGGGGTYWSTLDDCTVSDNSASTGGGSRYGTLNRCILSGNESSGQGGGSYYGTLNSCLLFDNTAGSFGGGSYYSTLYNCTLSENTANYGGGSYQGTLRNCIIYSNSAGTSGDNWYDSSPNFAYCCTTPLPSGSGNIDDNPQFANSSSGDFRLSDMSACINEGNNSYASDGPDLDGNPRIMYSIIDIGCYEYYEAPGVDITNFDFTVSFETTETSISGINSVWAEGFLFWSNSANEVSGSVELSGQDFVVSDVPLEFEENHITVFVTNLMGQSATDSIVVTRSTPVHYVSLTGGNVWPYTSWADAATCIQDAVDVAVDGDTVLVGDGVYDTGSTVAPARQSRNRVCITSSITLQSVNGPGATYIVGEGPVGTNAVRGVYMSAGLLCGFTITNGYTRMDGYLDYDRRGGGVNMYGGNGIVSNCTLSGNSAGYDGGGSCYGTLYNCTLSNNSSTNTGGGSYYGTLNNCIISENMTAVGGGSCYSSLNSCILSGNTASSDGGGSCRGTLNNCIFTGNAANRGGGSYYSELNNCTLTGNTAIENGGGSYCGTLHNCLLSGNLASIGGGISGGTLNNCTLSDNTADIKGGGCSFSTLTNSIVWGNSAGSYVNGYQCSMVYCCTTPLSSGDGNIDDDPEFVWLEGGVLFLQTNSPCINAGMNQSWMDGATDLAGRQRILEETVDMGVYEGAVCNIDTPIHYVSVSGGNTWPYTNWTDAATSIQNAIYAAEDGDTVLVADGVYNTGTIPTPGYDSLNRVAITNNILVQSVNGPENTFIVGAGPLGSDAVRGVYISDGVLSGFTITNGHTAVLITITNGYTVVAGNSWVDRSGGGVLGVENSGMITNCIILGNNAADYGGGCCDGIFNDCTISGNAADKSGGGCRGGVFISCTVSGNITEEYGGGCYDGVFSNCVISGNSTSGAGGGGREGVFNNCVISGNSAGGSGGGNYHGTLNNCTLAGNSSGSAGGGCRDAVLINCIVWDNTADSGDNWDDGIFSFCCTKPLPDGEGNMDYMPQFMDAAAGNYHLKASSPCIDAGDTASAVGTVDLDGISRIYSSAVDMGAYESTYASPQPLYLQITSPVDGSEICYQDDSIEGICSEWVVGSLTWCNMTNGTYGSLPAATNWVATGIPLDMGVNTIIISGINSSGDFAMDAITVIRTMMDGSDSPVHYVSPDGGSIWPYTNLVNAATNIQDAVDAAAGNDTVLVADGIYSTGEAVTPGYECRNRVCIARDITLQSVNGPESTFIVGVGPNGVNAVRGVYMTAGSLFGFTITNGHTATEGDLYDDQGGGGVSVGYGCDGLISNCVIVGNSAESRGGASCYGTLLDCELSGNTTAGSGGGSYQSILHRCVLSGNEAAGYGGGSSCGTLRNCVISGNSSDNDGGGCYNSSLYNCTVVGNSSDDIGGGCCYCTAVNCIVWDNTGTYGNYRYSGLSYCCSTPLPSGTGNINDDPQFIDADSGEYRLQFSSPCIDTGDNSGVESGDVDLDGRSRLIHNFVDMGAYEYPVPDTGMISTNATVYGEVPSCSISGSINEWLAGTMTWSNSATGAHGTIDTTGEWNVQDIALAYGDNVISVTGTNVYEGSYLQEITIIRLYEHGGNSPIHYVSLDGASVWPYTNWNDAATSIQDAINAASSGNQVQVFAGTYTPGEEIVVANGSVLIGIRESGMVIVDGQNEHRCFYLGGDSVVEGFIIRNGGGVDKGGGVYLNRGGTLRNCVVYGCTAAKGGGVYIDNDGTLEFLSICCNSADDSAGGVYCYFGGSAQNTIVYFNNAGSAFNNIYSGTFAYSCSPDLSGGSNISGDPCFVDRAGGCYHLRHNSPCIDVGTTISGVTNDLAGGLRPVDGNLDETPAFDMGAYEYQGAEADSDGDGRSDIDELNAGFNPYYNEAPAIEEGQNMVINAPGTYDLFTSESISDLSMGYMMLQTLNGWVSLNLQLEKCTNLTEGVWQEMGDAVEWQVPADSGKSFFRVRGRE